MEWEYKVENFKYQVNVNGLVIENSDELLEKTMNENGSNGWVLINSIPSYKNENLGEVSELKLIFTRQK